MTDGVTPPPTAPPPRRADARGFWGLVVAQFLGAFNDNAFKVLLTLLAADLMRQEAEKDGLVALSTALYMVPFVLFSAHAGALADRFSKRTVLNLAKLAEVAVTALAAVVFLAGGSVPALLAVLFLMATHSAYYGPAKYGVLPEILPEEKLARGNGVIEMTTFIAIILGTVAGSWLLPVFKAPGAPVAGSHLWIFSLILAALAAAGCASSFLLRPVAPADPGRRISINPLPDLLAMGKTIAASRVLRLTLLGIVYLWSLAVLAFQTLFLYGKSTLQLEDREVGFLQATMAVGIGAGSFACGLLSGKTIEMGLVPLGAAGLSLFSVGLFFTGGSFGWTLADLFGLGFSAGIFSVPLQALLQAESPPEKKGSIIAASQILTFLGMTLSAGIYYLLRVPLGLSPPAVFLLAGLATLAGTAYVLTLLPEALGRLILYLLTRSIYRIRILGRENLPDRGPALLVVNHVSYVDGLLILATTHRFIRFIMYKAITDLPPLRTFGRLMKVIPISNEEGPKAVITAFRVAEEALKQGELVCIFPEGQISRTGQMLPFRKGFERILKNVDAPVIPVHLDRVWGSIFSFQGRRFFKKVPRRWPYPVTVSFGKALPRTASAFEARQAVSELGSASYSGRSRDLEPLQRLFIRTARRAPRRTALADSSGTSRSFRETLERSIAMARILRDRWQGQEMVGILLPPSVPAALVNVAALLSGRIPVNLNYTASAEALRSAATQCALRSVVTSRAFLEKFPVEVPAEAIYLEDLAEKKLGAAEKLAIALVARWAPAQLVERFAGRRARIGPESVATVLFSSGSTGEPKGCLLTHTNLLSNIQALEQLFDPMPEDRVMGILPFFHSFGLMGTLWFPLTAGLGAVYHVSPLDAQAIGALVRKHGCTHLLTTPTFLGTYTRRVEPEAFGSLKVVVVGAEKLSDRVADAFRERFGITPLEGYGCTECSPLVAVNVPDHREKGIYQVGGKRGRIGHPVPNVSVRIVDPESFAPRPQGEAGLLLVRGPNVMKGYLGRPDLTEQAIRDGHYVTGDIATLDEDGFITITDRLSRFSKIAGEMVPHIKVESALHEALGAQEQLLAVTGLPDGQKGERLAVLHTLDDAALAKLFEKLPAAGLPNLWTPKREAFVRVEKLPMLGSGKLDLRKVKEIAAAAGAGA